MITRDISTKIDLFNVHIICSVKTPEKVQISFINPDGFDHSVVYFVSYTSESDVTDEDFVTGMIATEEFKQVYGYAKNIFGL